MNNSGMNPCGDRVVVLPEAVESVTAGGIIIPEKEAEKHQLAQVSGVLVAAGPDAWTHSTTITERRMGNGKWRETERKRTGYSGDFAKVGDRVCFARYNGLPFDAGRLHGRGAPRRSIAGATRCRDAQVPPEKYHHFGGHRRGCTRARCR